MYVTGSWTLQTINAVNPQMNMGVFPFPNQSGNARLIFEPNMTLMTSSKNSHSDAGDKVLHAIFASKDLASEIFDYTQTSSMLKNINPDVPLLIQPDIDRYHRMDMITDVTHGNTQLIWSFQEQVAKRLQDWLRGRVSLLLVCGQGQWEDTTGSLESTRRFAAVLASRQIRHELDLWGYDVPHDWPSWRAQVAHHLPRFC